MTKVLTELTWNDFIKSRKDGPEGRFYVEANIGGEWFKVGKSFDQPEKAYDWVGLWIGKGMKARIVEKHEEKNK